MTERILKQNFFKEKMAEVHNPIDVVAAFESSPALVFSPDIKAFGKIELFVKIWEAFPSAIITKCDLGIMAKEPLLCRNQFLMVLPNATKDETDSVYKIIKDSGVIPKGYVIYARKRAGLKLCALLELAKKDDSESRYVLKKANLIVDGDDLLMMIRTLNDKNIATLKEDGFFKDVKREEDTPGK